MIFLVAIVITMVNPLLSTNPYISDTDPSTYVVIPMLMLPVLAFFVIKDGVQPKLTKRSVALGIGFFLVFIALTLYLRFELSYYFLSYSIDFILYPLLLLSFVLLLFGKSNVKLFVPLLVYSLFASPLILSPLFGLNTGFAILNTQAIYHIISAFTQRLAYSYPITLTLGTNHIGIGNACVGLGAIIAIALFFLALSKFYSGARRDKIIWTAAGVILFIFLNFLRMLFITIVWLYYGPGSAISTVHSFAGILLFYIDIIVMILAAGRFGLNIGRIGVFSERKAKLPSPAYYGIGIALALLFALFYFMLTLYYSSGLYISPLLLANSQNSNLSYFFMNTSAGSLVNTAGFGMNYSLAYNGSYPVGEYIFLYNSSINANNPLLLYLGSNAEKLRSILMDNSMLEAEINVLDTKGISSSVYEVESGNVSFFVYTATIPYVQSDSVAQAGVFGVVPASEVNGSPACKLYEAYGTTLLNLANTGFYGATGDRMRSAYCLFSKVTDT